MLQIGSRPLCEGGCGRGHNLPSSTCFWSNLPIPLCPTSHLQPYLRVHLPFPANPTIFLDPPPTNFEANFPLLTIFKANRPRPATHVSSVDSHGLTWLECARVLLLARDVVATVTSRRVSVSIFAAGFARRIRPVGRVCTLPRGAQARQATAHVTPQSHLCVLPTGGSTVL